MQIVSEININASPEKIWAILMDFKAYPEWNPFVKSISGDPVVGKHIHVVLPGMKFEPEVLVLEENREFRWKGKLLVKGLFDGEHYFVLEVMGDGVTRLLHGENFSGMLVPLFKKRLEGETLESFKAMNQGLKERAEGI
ncbi:SRPBCC domain-containing protein [Reichenbachiella agarivorans]|uniref:SRPBCC domain-containing protein n=1 Tax=Reichenbachiella agarivorans TaxID=2979464 RepID=A0ABY6CU42_9BACT|nr:SRPBCC domain-containing protein [Reichenbachiella agarivorans]UXP33404.1 SRPBCC domain-containing protein [Reichenbachiella agarivorans]